ncbi:hypothetical protein, partial [Staphylococcus aureus]|uniref:hypothetical protein n=1 Tax=Staphylococcus aureus TaxID=1280 RepID=UPI00132F681B
ALFMLLWPQLRLPPPEGTGGATAMVESSRGLAQDKARAIACYASQWPLFYNSVPSFLDAFTEYGRALGYSGVVERTWQIA